MSEKKNTGQKAYADALRDLFSADDKVVVSAVSKLSKVGDHKAIYPLLEVMINGSEEVSYAVEQVLFQLKDTKSMNVLIEALDNPKYLQVRPAILAAFWNTGQWPIDHLHKLCEIAVDGTYNEAFEVLTIVEHMEGELEPAEVQPALESLREFLMQGENHPNFAIIELIYSALNAAEDV